MNSMGKYHTIGQPGRQDKRGFMPSARSFMPVFMVIAFFLLAGFINAQSNFRWLNPYPQGSAIYGVAYGKNQFVAVGAKGAILSSVDGSNWRIQSSGFTDDLFSIAFGNNTFVALGPGKVLISSDGINWTAEAAPSFNGFGINNIQWVNTMFIAGGYGLLFTSPDGISWTRCPTGMNGYINGFAYGNNTYVAVGYEGMIATSTDGIQWWPYNKYDPFDDIYSVAFGNGVFVAVGLGGIIRTSTGGGSWSNISSGAGMVLSEIAFGQGIFIAISWTGSIITSTKGSTWTFSISGTSNYLTSIAYGNGRFVIVGLHGTILTSTDGSSWTNISSKLTAKLTTSVWAEDRFVSVGEPAATAAFKNDTLRIISNEQSEFLTSMVYHSGNHVAVGLNGAIITSGDAINWTRRNSGTQADLKSICWGNNQFVAVGDSGKILASSDAITWSGRTYGFHDYLSSIIFANNRFYIAGQRAGAGDGIILSSSDGITWQSHTTSEWLTAMAYGNGKFIAVGRFYYAVTSNDGIIWSETGIPCSENLRAINFGDHHFVTVGENGSIFYSTDGGTWNNNSIGTSDTLHSVCFGNNSFYIVGDSGTILIAAEDPVNTIRNKSDVNLSGLKLRVLADHNRMVVKLPRDFLNKNIRPALFSATGRQIKTPPFHLNNGMLVFNPSDIALGMFFLSIQNGTGKVLTVPFVNVQSF